MLPVGAIAGRIRFCHTRKAVAARKRSKFVKWAATSILTGWAAALPILPPSARSGLMLTLCLCLTSAGVAGRS